MARALRSVRLWVLQSSQSNQSPLGQVFQNFCMSPSQDLANANTLGRAFMALRSAKVKSEIVFTFDCSKETPVSALTAWLGLFHDKVHDGMNLSIRHECALHADQLC